MNDILERARDIQRKQAECYDVRIKLSTLQDMIAELERLRQVEADWLHDRAKAVANGV